jgi:peptide/nickel transport system permease protein
VFAFVLRRLFSAAVTLWLASVMIFGLLRLTPGNPAVVLAGLDPTRARVNGITKELGLNLPLTTQYAHWISAVARGSFGISYVYDVPISTLIAQRLGNTLLLMAVAMGLAVVLGFALGVVAALTRAGHVRGSITVFATFSLTIPTFITGVVFILLFAVEWRAFPAGGYVSITSNPVEGLKSLALPAITLALPIAAVIARFMQTSLLQAYDEQYVQTATAKGLSRARILLRHALPNALPPVITVTGIQMGQLIGGAVIVEATFAWPGLAQLSVQAVEKRDYPVVQDVLLLAVLVFIVIQLATDIVHAMLDPRMRARIA